MRLTLLILAINAEKELTRILPQLQHIGDELVIGIDDTTTDATADVARQFTARIYPVSHEGFRGRGKPEDLNALECMLPYCSGDWVLRVDQDETLSTRWHDRDYIARLLGDRHASHYWIPRRWALPPGDHYLCGGHWHPDYQLRLFRNTDSLVKFNRVPHSPVMVFGEARYLTDSWIVHWDLVWHDRRWREAKVEMYRSLGTYTGAEFYLYEDQGYATRCLDYVPQSARAHHKVQADGGFFCAALDVLDCPEAMTAGKTESVLIGITNRSSRLFRPTSIGVRPGNVMLSWHWYTAIASPAIYHWEGARCDLPTRLAPGESASCFMTVTAPQTAGDYLLQPDLVEEHVAWLSQHCPVPTHPVRVV